MSESKQGCAVQVLPGFDQIPKVAVPITLDEVFCGDGVLSKANPGYKLRPGQLSMAKAVEEAIDKQEALMAEGPTGVGKSFAYMIPAMLKMLRRDATDAKRVVIATANIALQDQLYLKDMPFLTSVLPGCRNMKYMLVKGRSNYACLLKVEEIEDKRDELKEETKSAEYLLVPKDDKENEDVLDPEVSELLEWLQHTTTGDKNELPKVYEKWGSISTSSEECLGSKCPYKNDCFTSRARRKMKVTPILIANYHFLLTSPDMVEDAVLICDEAHDLADIARDVLGWEMSRSTFSKSVSFVSKVCTKTAEFLKQHLNDLWMAIEDRIRSGKHSHLRIRSWNDTGFSLEKIISTLSDAIVMVEKLVEKAPDDLKLNRGLNRLNNAMGRFEELQSIGSCDSDDRVYWFEKANNGWITIHAAYIDVSEILNRILYDKARTVIMTSATMTTGGSFEFIKADTGLETSREIRAPSPFDLKRQGIIVVPKDMPDIPKWNDRANTIEWYQKAGEYAVQLMKICGGRCLMLFTSWKSLDEVHKIVSREAKICNIRVLHQREAPKMKLIEQFKEDETSVLFGVASFWQGIDVPGKALSGLFIDKIPFMVPNTPFNEALGEMVENRGGNAFMDLSVPKATIALCQGVGRLIRTTSDRGIVVITDTRLINKRYGEQMIRSLPEFKKVQSMDGAIGFLGPLI